MLLPAYGFYRLGVGSWHLNNCENEMNKKKKMETLATIIDLDIKHTPSIDSSGESSQQNGDVQGMCTIESMGRVEMRTL